MMERRRRGGKENEGKWMKEKRREGGEIKG